MDLAAWSAPPNTAATQLCVSPSTERQQGGGKAGWFAEVGTCHQFVELLALSPWIV
jgi:hypothetical protein